MLKNKKTLYVTLPLAFGIWGYIAYKVYEGLKGDDVILPATTNEMPLAAISQEKDTFSLFNNYRDPFLTGSRPNIVAQTGNHATVQPKTQAKTLSVPANKSWPSVVYSGIVKNQSNATSLILLTINGKLRTMKQGEIADGLKVVSFSNNEVVLLYEKEKKTFIR